MTIAAILILAGAMLSWMAVRRCPLGRAVGRQINMIAAASR